MIQSKKDYLHYLSEDLRAYQLNTYSFWIGFKSPILRFQRRLRKIEYINNCKKNPISKIFLLYLRYLNNKLAIRLGFSIPPNVFGPGLCLPHYGTIVITAKSKVGKNCRIHPGTALGAYHGAPQIGDNVYIGPGAKLYGDITIGNNVSIGANCVVNKSFPENVALGGIPADIISNKSTKELGMFPEGFL